MGDTDKKLLEELGANIKGMKESAEGDYSGLKTSLDGQIDAADKLYESNEPAERAQAGLDLISNGLDMLVAIGAIPSPFTPVAIVLHTVGKLIYAFGKPKAKTEKDPMFVVMEVLLEKIREAEVKIPAALAHELMQQKMDRVDAILILMVSKYDTFIKDPTNNSVYEEMLENLEEIEEEMQLLKLSIVRLGTGKGHDSKYTTEYAKLAIRLLPRIYSLSIRYVLKAGFQILPVASTCTHISEKNKQDAATRTNELMSFLKDMKTRYDDLLIGSLTCAKIFKLDFYHLQEDLATYRKYFNCPKKWVESGFALTLEQCKGKWSPPVYLVHLEENGPKLCRNNETKFVIHMDNGHILIDDKYFGVQKTVNTWFMGKTSYSDKVELFTEEEIKIPNRDDTGSFNSFNNWNDQFVRHNVDWEFKHSECEKGKALKTAPLLDNYYSYSTQKYKNGPWVQKKWYTKSEDRVLKINGEIKGTEDKKILYYLLPHNYDLSISKDSKIDTQIDGGGWKLVRHTPAGNTWHKATDQLRGTDSYGKPSGPTSDETWSIPFENEIFNQFLFATGDESQWLIAEKDVVTGGWHANGERRVLKSSINPLIHTVKWILGAIEDPRISLTDFAIGGDILYGENSYCGADVLPKCYGANVYIRMKKRWDASFVPDGGWWYVMNDKIQMGTTGDIPVPGNYVNKGEMRLAVWRPSDGNWCIKGTGPTDWDSTGTVTPWGTRGDVPVPGDYNGDGLTSLAVWRPSDGKWYIKGPGLADYWVNYASNMAIQCGMSGDIPVPFDYYGEGKLRMAVFRPSNGIWYIKGAGFSDWAHSSGNVEMWCGMSGDVPVPGSYFGEDAVRIGVWRPSDGTWYLKSRGLIAGQNWGVQPGDDVILEWGTRGDIPTPYDFSGEGTARIAVYRPSDRYWYIKGPGKKKYSESEGNIRFKGTAAPHDGQVPVDIHKYINTRCSTSK